MIRAESEAAMTEAIDSGRHGVCWWSGAEMARIAYRRWFSFGQRSKSKRPIYEERVIDLAKGLRDHFEPSGLYTPQAEWLRLAEVLAFILSQT